jgi:ubiquinone/menaquinone biosynthesis C-methylase UbiE
MSRSDLRSQRQVEKNIRVHDRIARRYDALHGEIFNDVEQARLNAALAEARDQILTGATPPQALDFGCGSGNLTRHLLGLGFDVTAADVSQGFLDLVSNRYASPRLRTLLMDSGRISELSDGIFDFAAAYSVLHHIPDYLQACRELARVCKPGGVVVLDHEHTEGFWLGNPLYDEFRSRALRFDWRKYLIPENYLHRVIRVFNPRHSNEGDIHVWPDDHIEWSQIRDAMGEENMEVIVEREYLLNHKLYRPNVYRQYLGRCTDMKMMILRKRH